MNQLLNSRQLIKHGHYIKYLNVSDKSATDGRRLNLVYLKMALVQQPGIPLYGNQNTIIYLMIIPSGGISYD